MLEPAGQSAPRTPPVNPQLALRVAILGGVAFALFAIVFLRLWFLQVLTGDQYRQDALDNRVRTVAISAPRGNILDRDGTPIVENRVATVVQLDPRRLPQAERDAAARWGQQMTARSKRPKRERGPVVPIPAPATPELAARYARLAAVLGVSRRRVSASVIQQLAVLPYANVRVRVDVPQSMRNYLLEHQSDFPGIAVQQVYLRRYPLGTTAAQLVGTTGEINPDEVGTDTYRGVKPGTIVGQGGLERSYDRYLRGVAGVQSITVDAAGRPKAQRLARAQRRNEAGEDGAVAMGTTNRLGPRQDALHPAHSPARARREQALHGDAEMHGGGSVRTRAAGHSAPGGGRITCQSSAARGLTGALGCRADRPSSSVFSTVGPV